MRQPTTNARALRSRSTDAERLLWAHLRSRQLLGLKFRRQFPVGNYITDFYCHERQLVVELDGGQHASSVVYDLRRQCYLESRGLRVLRFWNDQVLRETEAVLEVIASVCAAGPSPCPSPGGRGDA